MKKSIKQALSLLLVAAMLIACIPAAMAAEDQTSGTVPVAITASTPAFSVTVPTTLPIHMDAYGNVTCGNITITNNSAGPVLVEDTQLTALNGWALVDYDTTTFSDTDKGQHRVALQLNRGNGVTAAGADIGQDFIPAKGGQQTVSVAVKLPYQGVEMTNAAIAQVVFVLGWKEVLPPPAPADALPSFTIRLGAGGYRRNGTSWSAGCTITLYAVSQVGDNVLYEGTSFLAPPYDNYVTNSVQITDIPANLEEGIVSIRANNENFNHQNGTWTGSGSLVPVYESDVTLNVQLELTLDVSTTVKEPTPSTAPPTPTPT